MTSILGNLSLCGAVLVAAGAILASAAAIRFRSPGYQRVARWSIAAIALLLTVTVAALLTALLQSDFRLTYVVGYTERALPVGYKLAALWAGQEGSLLLWAWLLAILCLVAAIGYRKLIGTEHAVALGAMAAVCGFFAVLLLFAANPFQLVQGAVPRDGRGLNPMLQDPGMIIHPPLLFLGYAGFTVPLAVMIGVLVAGRRDNRWVVLVRRWLLVSWVFLGAGIILGAWWAYVELGWGGYWAWDPVENASLLPWLTSTALLHSMMVQQHRGMFKLWNVSLIALTFILCIFGTYLTRSGVIESVHAFGGSLLGVFFLVFLGLCTVVCGGLIIWRARALRPEHPLEGLISREGAFLLTNVLLLVMMVITLVGTIFPLLSGPFLDEPMTIKAPFYNRVVAPMCLVLVGLMAIGPVLAFGKSAAGKIARSLVVPGLAALTVTAVVGIVATHNLWALVCVALVTLGTFAVIVDFVRSVSARRRSTGENPVAAAVRLIDRDHRRYGGQLAHLGIMMIVVGIAGSSLFADEQTHRLRPGETVEAGRYTVTFVSLDQVREVNFTAVQAAVKLTGPDGEATTLYPQRRFYDTWDEPNSEVALRSNWRDDVYLTLAGWEAGGAVTAIQVRVNPLVLWIWIGGIVLAAGGLFCVLPRLLPRAQRVEAILPAEAARPDEEPSLQPATRSAPAPAEVSP
ncbi:MAG: heme lyase CcmF/NrfE family subunit [Planctomycetota bacterium]|jgi:cytochrome c-type biogenesis protein CcmF